MATKPQECLQTPRKHGRDCAGTLMGVFGNTLVCVLTELLTYLMIPVNTFCFREFKPLLSGLVFPWILFYRWLVWYFFLTETPILFILLGTARECGCGTKLSIQMRLCVWNSSTLASQREPSFIQGLAAYPWLQGRCDFSQPYFPMQAEWDRGLP